MLGAQVLSLIPLIAHFSRATALLSEIISGITLYFDKALGNNLLYRFERAQYVEQKRASSDKAMSEIYGAEHLLRLFGKSGLHVRDFSPSQLASGKV